MVINLKQYLKDIFFRFGPSIIFYQKSYAQEGEDIVVNRLLEGQKKGFYVDIGAHHPCRFSNTYFFYKKGWSGICIDPLPNTKKLFKKIRPKDQVLEIGISEVAGKIKYYMFNEPDLNTFNSEVANSRNGVNNFKLIQTIEISTLPLADVLKVYTIPKSGIDLLSVDVEGFDLEVLKSNDWSVFKPKVIIAEALGAKMENIENDLIYKFLVDKGYSVYAKTGYSMIFLKSDFLTQ